MMKDNLDDLLLSVYAPDDAVDTNLAWYYESKWIRIASVLGLPNRYLGDKNQVPLNRSASFFIQSLLQNFFGWRSKHNPLALLIRVLLTTSYQVLTTPLRLLLNILKVGSELIPGLLVLSVWKFTKLIFNRLQNLLESPHNNQLGGASRAYYSIARVLLILLTIPVVLGLSFTLLGSIGVFFLGHCFTSPIQTLNEAWKVGKEKSLFRGILYVIGVMTVISLLYMVAFPLGVKVLTLNVLPMLPQLLPSALLPLYQAVARILSPVFTGFGSIVLQIANTTVLPVLQGIFGSTVTQFLSAIIASMPAAVGGGVIFGALMGVGPGIYRIGNMLLQGLGQGITHLFQRIHRRLHPSTPIPTPDTTTTDNQGLSSAFDQVGQAAAPVQQAGIVAQNLAASTAQPSNLATAMIATNQTIESFTDDASSTRSNEYQDAFENLSLSNFSIPLAVSTSRRNTSAISGSRGTSYHSAENANGFIPLSASRSSLFYTPVDNGSAHNSEDQDNDEFHLALSQFD